MVQVIVRIDNKTVVGVDLRREARGEARGEDQVKYQRLQAKSRSATIDPRRGLNQILECKPVLLSTNCPASVKRKVGVVHCWGVRSGVRTQDALRDMVLFIVSNMPHCGRTVGRVVNVSRATNRGTYSSRTLAKSLARSCTFFRGNVVQLQQESCRIPARIMARNTARNTSWKNPTCAVPTTVARFQARFLAGP